MNYSPSMWMREFETLGAFWLYKGEISPDRPHVELTAGGHSNGFFNGGKVLANPLVSRLLTEDLVELLRHTGCDFRKIDRVVGPATGAITLADRLAEAMHRGYFNPEEPGDDAPVIYSCYSEKETISIPDPDGLDRKCFAETGAFKLARADAKGKCFIAAEDTTTTGTSVGKTIDGIEAAGGTVYPYVLVICNRSGRQMLGDRKILSLISPDIKTWSREECPYCKAGSVALRAKTHWAELTAV